MQKNEKKFYSIIIEKKNNLQKLNNRKSTKNDIPKFRNSSRNKIINLQGNTSSRFNLYKNYILSINDSKESLVGKEKLFSNFFNINGGLEIPEMERHPYFRSHKIMKMYVMK